MGAGRVTEAGLPSCPHAAISSSPRLSRTVHTRPPCIEEGGKEASDCIEEAGGGGEKGCRGSWSCSHVRAHHVGMTSGDPVRKRQRRLLSIPCAESLGISCSLGHK